jgi:small GTP-binding protein
MADSKVFKLKVSLLGDGAVGKTSLIKKYVYDEFDDKYLLTLGAKTTLKKIGMETEDSKINVECNLMIWDIMGQKEFERLHKTFFRGTKGAFVVTDITRRETLESVEDWINRLYDVTGPIPLVFVINKCDLMDKAEFKKEDLEQIALKYKSPVFMSSAKTGQDVDKFFFSLGQMLIEKSLFEKLKSFDDTIGADTDAVAAAAAAATEVTPPAPEVPAEEEEKKEEEEAAPPTPGEPAAAKAPEAPKPPAATADSSLPLIQQLQTHIDAINEHFEKYKQEIQAFEEEKAKFQKGKEEGPPPAEGEEKPSPAKSSISWED